MRERRERKWRGFTNQIDAATRDRRRPSSLSFFFSIVLRGFLDDWSSSMLSILATRDAARGLDEKCFIKEEGVVAPPCYCLLGTLPDPLIAC
jgi:hypothetical protein